MQGKKTLTDATRFCAPEGLLEAREEQELAARKEAEKSEGSGSNAINRTSWRKKLSVLLPVLYKAFAMMAQVENPANQQDDD